MFTVIATFILGSIIGLIVYGSSHSFVWSTVSGLAVMMLAQLGVGLWIRRKVMAVNQRIQQGIEESQKKVNRRMQIMQQRPVGSVKTAQQILEKLQEEGVRQAIAETDELRKYYNWNFLLRKQINTMRMTLYYQIRDFAEVDKLLPDTITMDVHSCAMKLARMYKNNDPGLDKFFRSRARRFKGDNCVLLYALYSWILVKRDKVKEAVASLVEARKKTDNPVIVDNHEKLVNGKVKHFSNAGLGQEWYMLYLEEPKVKTQRMVPRGF